jgi:large subunit ribosomal protein L5
MSRLKQHYQDEVVPALIKEFGYKNVMEVPKIVKITVNVGLGEAIQNVKLLDSTVTEIASITGQRPVITKARKSIASFKLRKGMPIGCMVTLRRSKMFDFLEKLVHIALPRVRDFRGIPNKSFDGRGNFSMGLKEQIIFPEIEYDTVEKIKGMNISITTTAKTDEEARFLIGAMGMPFRK